MQPAAHGVEIRFPDAGMDAVAQQDPLAPLLRLQPQRGAGEAAVADRAAGKAPGRRRRRATEFSWKPIVRPLGVPGSAVLPEEGDGVAGAAGWRYPGKNSRPRRTGRGRWRTARRCRRCRRRNSELASCTSPRISSLRQEKRAAAASCSAGPCPARSGCRSRWGRSAASAPAARPGRCRCRPSGAKINSRGELPESGPGDLFQEVAQQDVADVGVVDPAAGQRIDGHDHLGPGRPGGGRGRTGTRA